MAQAVGAFDIDACPLSGSLDELADGGVGVAGAWVDEDVAGGFAVFPDPCSKFLGQDGVPGFSAFGAAKVEPAVFSQVFPFDVPGLNPAQAGFVDEQYQ